MIILDERNFLRKELAEKGFEIFDFFDGVQVLDMKTFASLELKRRSDFLLVDTETVLRHPELQESFKSLVNTYLGAVFFHDHSHKTAQDWVRDTGAFLGKIHGEYALPMPQLSWTILANQLQFYWGLLEEQKKLQNHLVQLSRELDQVLQNSEEELFRAKKIHDMFVPRRSEEIKGITFTNKYASGNGGGIEFYDLIQTPTKIYQVLFSCQSYLVSSAILGILGQQKEKGFQPEQFISEVTLEVDTINSAKKKKSFFDLLVTEIDLANLKLTSHTKAKAEFYSQLKGRTEISKGMVYQLEKGEKVIVFSSGFIFNWNEGRPDQDLYEFVKASAELSQHELMSELFFQLKEDRAGDFLKKDATVVMLEVNRHGIHKV